MVFKLPQPFSGAREVREFVCFRVACRHDEGAPLHMIEGDEPIVNVQKRLRDIGRRRMRLQFGFEQAAELIGDDSGEAALEWRKTVNVGEPMLLQQASDIRKRVGSR